MGFLFSILIVGLLSCEREQLAPAKPVEEERSTIDSLTANTSQNKSETISQSELIGNGSGVLELRDISDKKYTIKEGTYTALRFQNIKNVNIDGLGKVKVTNGNVDIGNVDNLTLSGIEIHDYDQAAIYVHTSANNLTLSNIKLKNINNYGVRFDINKKYDGSPSSFSNNIHLTNIHAENIGTLFISQGGIQNDGFYGLIKNFKLTNSKVVNSPYLNGLTSIGCAEDYEMSNNVIDNVNASDKYPNGANNHTGIFYAQGNGKIFNNKATNFQGNLVRAWLFSITKPGIVEIYNNIAYNSTRYSAFELQVPPSTKNFASFKPANAKVYNNTVGKLNTGEPKFFEGRLLDLYQTHGQVEIYNNLTFDMRDDILVHNMSDASTTKITKVSNNHYFKRTQDAINDLINFSSKIVGVGAKL